MYTLHEDFGLAHDFLLEVIGKKYSQKKFLNRVEKFLKELNSSKTEQVTKEDIDEWIEECIWEANDMYDRGQITKEQRDRYIKMDSDREKVRKMLEEEKPIHELIASAEFISATLDKPTKSFYNFLEFSKFDNKIEKNFEIIKSKYEKDKLIAIIPTILESVIYKLKDDDTIYALGIYDQKDIISWKKSAAELEDSLKSFI